MKKILAIMATIALMASCVSTTVVPGDDDSRLNEAQRLEKHDDYVPWWKYEF